jgi:glycosyltransferase involved in cell wall biosynthesis
MPKISIIIPVYNAENYLEECLLSISQQTFGDFEILAINDGSTDRSLEILKKYQAKEPRLQVISQENKGVSAARNLGLDNAKGEYIAFVDADDFY